MSMFYNPNNTGVTRYGINNPVLSVMDIYNMSYRQQVIDDKVYCDKDGVITNIITITRQQSGMLTSNIPHTVTSAKTYIPVNVKCNIRSYKTSNSQLTNRTKLKTEKYTLNLQENKKQRQKRQRSLSKAVNKSKYTVNVSKVRDVAMQALFERTLQEYETRYGFQLTSQKVFNACGCFGKYTKHDNNVKYTSLCNTHFFNSDIAKKSKVMVYNKPANFSRVTSIKGIASYNQKYGLTNIIK